MKNPNEILSNFLLITAFSVFIMVITGGLTRLTGSGLSMVEWHPITGILPPLTKTEWIKIFDLYKLSPEYRMVYPDMILGEFKKIFWLEYIHRLIGRIIGIIFLIPVIMSICYQSLRQYFLKMLGILCLGGLQGIIGWYMVKSGLNQDPMVSPYRLCLHLLTAFFTFGIIIWHYLNIKNRSSIKFINITKYPVLVIIMVLIITTIAYGAFVAGLKAGLIYNTFPLMGDSVIPDEIFYLHPKWKNLFANHATVQFIHRILAISVFIVITIFVYIELKKTHSKDIKNALLLMFSTTTLQFILGVATILSKVNIIIATLHQGTALILFKTTIITIYLYTKQDK